MWFKASAMAAALVVFAPHSPAETFKAEDIFQLEYASQVSISPNGQYIAYLRNSFDDMSDSTRRSLWLVDTNTGKALPIFDDGHSYSNLSWSHDGSRLAFTSNRNDKNQIHVYWVDEAKLAKITNVHQSPSNLSWSNDDQHIAFMMSVKAAATDFAKSVKMPARPKGAKWSDLSLIHISEPTRPY